MEEDDLVLCTVEKVTNTITFVRLPDGREGTIISSEIAPGRIKFMRQYVVPNKKIVCKVLKDSGDHVHLSLRRVNSKEKRDVLFKFKQEQAITVALKQIFGEDKSKMYKEKIFENFGSLTDFVNAAREDESLIEKYLPKESEKQEAIRKIIDKKKKSQEIKKMVHLKCLEEDGVIRIKKIFDLNDSSIHITYVSAGEFLLRLNVEDFKEGKKKMTDILESIEKNAKASLCEFSVLEEK